MHISFRQYCHIRVISTYIFNSQHSDIYKVMRIKNYQLHLFHRCASTVLGKHGTKHDDDVSTGQQRGWRRWNEPPGHDVVAGE